MSSNRPLTRRGLVAAGASWAALSGAVAPLFARRPGQEPGDQSKEAVRPDTAETFGLVGKIVAQEGKGRELAEILVAGSTGMAGNIAYLVALDAENPDEIWVHEVWESAEAHRASLGTESVQQAIAKGRPLIERFEMSRPVLPVS